MFSDIILGKAGVMRVMRRKRRKRHRSRRAWWRRSRRGCLGSSRGQAKKVICMGLEREGQKFGHPVDVHDHNRAVRGQLVPNFVGYWCYLSADEDGDVDAGKLRNTKTKDIAIVVQ